MINTSNKELIKKNILTKNEVRLLNRRINAGDEEAREVPEDGFQLTQEQTEKGLNWLNNQWKTPDFHFL